MGWSTLFILVAALSLVAAEPPDKTLDTIPVLYYGANWNRSEVNIDVLARMQVVVLMQEDGDCWAMCCPKRFENAGQCGWQANDAPATSIPGCNASCAQHGAQEQTFARIKASAKQQGLRPPHFVLYMNGVYLWPFDAASALGDQARVLDIQGEPHAESCDPGIFPSWFFDFSRAAGAQAWLNLVKTHVVSGVADGVYVDCDGTVPFHCPSPSGGADDVCIARRNGREKSVHENVTRAQVEAYVAGKNATQLEAYRLVSASGGAWYNKGAPPGRNASECVTWDPAKHAGRTPGDCAGNMIWIDKVGELPPPPQLAKDIEANMAAGYEYVVVGGANAYSNPKKETPQKGQDLADGRSLRTCPDSAVAAFLLAVQPGAYLLCNGWDARFGRALGLPRGAAAYDAENKVWTRSFAGGAVASWNETAATGHVRWPGGDEMVEHEGRAVL